MSREFLVIMAPTQKEIDWLENHHRWYRYTPGWKFARRVRIFFKRSIKKWMIRQ